MCGIIVLCMTAVMGLNWDSWECWNCKSTPPIFSEPSINHKELRLLVISWIINDYVDTSYYMVEGMHNMSQQTASESSDDFEPLSKKVKLEVIEDIPVYESAITDMLPDDYLYNTFEILAFENTETFECKFRVMMQTEDAARKWLQKYNEKCKETMVYERSKKRDGKRVIKKLFLRCQHKQRQTGQHTKSDRILVTTHKQHNAKHTNCPAQMTLTILVPQQRWKGYCVEVSLKHIHNHLIHIADALRFRPISESTKDAYYELFRHGHSPSSAHLEYETNLMYTDPHVLADRHENPKVSDVYNLFNKWRKCNLGVKAGKELFTLLEEKVIAYNKENAKVGGRAVLQRFYKGDTKQDEQPLILAICTPLMARVHEGIQQSKELIFVDSSSSFDDFNNPMFVVSTSSAGGGLPLGVVVTSGESSSIVHQAMCALKGVFPNQAFYGQNYPNNIITDDSSSERDGLKNTWPTATLYLCVFHFLQSMWRWLTCAKNCIDKNDRQHLMQCVRKLVYAETEIVLHDEYDKLKRDSIGLKYSNFAAHLTHYWKRKTEWAVCYRNHSLLRGIDTNNYAESGIRILKDIVFRRVRAYNLIQVFEFIVVTFELYYMRRLLAIAHNRMDRYISLRYKGLGARQVDPSDITQSSMTVYIVKSKRCEGHEYEVDTNKWTCTCSVGRTGYPSGEPCKHQHAVAKYYNLQAPTLIPYFNSEGRYMHAVLALGHDEAGDKRYYVSIRDKESEHIHNTVRTVNTEVESTESGPANLDTMLEIMEEHDEMIDEIKGLCSQFVSDVEQRTKQLNVPYLTGIKKFLELYISTVNSIEPETCAAPQLASLLHTYFSKHITKVAGTRNICVQPTALSRRQRPAKGSKLALSGRPVGKKIMDCNTQTRRGRQEHTKRKQNLRKNELKNLPNQFKHGQGH